MVPVGPITFDQVSLPVATLMATVRAPLTPAPVAVLPIRYMVAPSGLMAADSRNSDWAVSLLAHFWAPVTAE